MGLRRGPAVSAIAKACSGESELTLVLPRPAGGVPPSSETTPPTCRLRNENSRLMAVISRWFSLLLGRHSAMTEFTLGSGENELRDIRASCLTSEETWAITLMAL